MLLLLPSEQVGIGGVQRHRVHLDARAPLALLILLPAPEPTLLATRRRNVPRTLRELGDIAFGELRFRSRVGGHSRVGLVRNFPPGPVNDGSPLDLLGLDKFFLTVLVHVDDFLLEGPELLL